MIDTEAEGLAEIMHQLAVLLDLSIGQENEAVVAMHLQIAEKMAKSVMEFSLPDDAEPAPVFRP